MAASDRLPFVGKRPTRWRCLANHHPAIPLPHRREDSRLYVYGLLMGRSRPLSAITASVMSDSINAPGADRARRSGFRTRHIRENLVEVAHVQTSPGSPGIS